MPTINSTQNSLSQSSNTNLKNSEKIGVLLCNLGTPDSTSVPDVRKYLKEFLGDPLVIDIPAPLRWFLLNAIILPFRPARSAEAYRAIWTDKGSPLLSISIEQTKLFEASLRKQGIMWEVEVGMRYGNPSIKSALSALKDKGITQLIFLPLYPQYALSSSVTAQKKLKEDLISLNYNTQLADGTSLDFYKHPSFITSWVEVIQQAVGTTASAFDHLLFSFHGLPERQVRKTEQKSQHCFSNSCCDKIQEGLNGQCYRAQCYATARLIASDLKLDSSQWSVSFQSRLGRTPWIQPFTDHVIPELAHKGVKHLAVVCPSFVTDCLETLEEIKIRARHDFLEAGGAKFTAIPCLNTHPRWIQTMQELAEQLRTM